MKYKNIQAAHEARMWIKDVIVPAAVGLVMIDRMNPQIKYNIRDKLKKKKCDIVKFTKEAK